MRSVNVERKSRGSARVARAAQLAAEASGLRFSRAAAATAAPACFFRLLSPPWCRAWRCSPAGR